MMKKLAGSLMIAISLTGCVSDTVSQVVERNVVRSDRFVQLMEEDRTTRQQEQDFIKANRAGWHTMDYHLNDAKLPADLQHLAKEEE